MNAHDAKVVAEFLLANLEHELRTTVGVFAAVPNVNLDYRPDPRAKSALALMRHIALEDEWFLNSIADGRFSPVPDQSDACGIMTPTDAASEYEKRIPAAIARVRALDGDALARPIDFMGTIQLPALVFLSMLIRHSTHHRGQLSTYIRPMGGKVPSIYGPTADTVVAAHA